MSICRLLKTFIISPGSQSGPLLEELQLWGGMEISSVSGEPVRDEESESCHRLSFILQVLERYAPGESALRKLREGLPRVTPARVREIESSLPVDQAYTRLRELDRDIKDALSKITEAERENRILWEIKDIPAAGKDLEFKEVRARIGLFQGREADPDIPSGLFHIEKVSVRYSAVFYMKDRADDAERFLEDAGFRDAPLPREISPLNKIKRNNDLIDKMKESIAAFEETVKKEYIPDIINFRVLMDICENRMVRAQEELKSARTDYTLLVKGWIPEDEEARLRELLEKKFPLCHIECEEVSEDDTPPVLLKNSRLLQPFELVTTLYGTPAYGQVDPTPYTAPFFILFFGLCLSDAGYGGIIVLVSAFALLRFRLARAARRFIKMLLWGGGMSVITGALMGSWFGNAAEGSFLDRLKVFDVLESPEVFLYFSVALGFLHVIFGVLISAGKNLAVKDYRAAFFSDIPWIAILFFGGLYAISGFTALPDFLSGVSGAFALAGAAAVVLLSGYRSSNIAARVGSGLYNLYGGIDYVKDMLSYSRLFALGMATGILAMAVNEIAGFLTSGIGYLLIPFVLIGGHLVLNLFMSSLSAYVHTSRLQYVEFYTKFFRGGGRNFSPLSWRNRRVELVASE